MLFASEKLAKVKSEKGFYTIENGNKWQKDCLFGIIDCLGKNTDLQNILNQDIDIMICDDGSKNEVADFILASTKKKKVIFIHAKAAKTIRPYSASALMEICGQATKNLNYISRVNTSMPPNIKNWNKPWKVASVKGEVRERIRLGNRKPMKIWGEIYNNIIKNPLADREIWIMLGHILSKSKFEKNLSYRDPLPEAIQLLYILQSTMVNIEKVGVKLRIFCMP